MWSYFWKLLFGGPRENTTSTSTTATNSVLHSSAEQKKIKLERDDQGLNVCEVSSTNIEDTPRALNIETESERQSGIKANYSVPAEGTNSAEIETKSTAEVEHKYNKIHQAFGEKFDWQMHFQEIELTRKDGYLAQAEEMFEKAISNKAPIDIYSEGLFKIWRLQNKFDLKSEKFEMVQKRVLKMLDIYAPGLKITDARSLHKVADLLGNEEVKERALKVINLIESSK